MPPSRGPASPPNGAARRLPAFHTPQPSTGERQMTYRPVSIVAPLAASICLLLAGTTGASAQIQCWMAPSAGPPIVHDAHIFCGEIRQRANGTFYATGFHSRPGGINPVGPGGAAIIGNG